ncbi:MAG: triose-phosphate isomerase [Hyphomicrobiales bacterium]|nr:triose-phosphate isomerase [Hyphomicrobiales bacterium]MDE2115036.1 triose-phosphate isomerase [Hyphomicrobiales bacterium]
MTTRTKLIAGNWKMNGLKADLAEISGMCARLATLKNSPVETLICPPALLVAEAAGLASLSKLQIGGQDCHMQVKGAHTGDVSAAMLKDAGASHVILGHSERRADHGETDAMVCAKAKAAKAAGLTAIICVGETQNERAQGREYAVVGAQLAGSLSQASQAGDTIIAYEPVWAIGTGLTPSLEDVAQMHNFIRNELARAMGEESQGVRILYGGSVKPGNAESLMSVANVDGALVGGASLKCDDFMAIVEALKL